MKKIIVASVIIECNEGAKLRLEPSDGFVRPVKKAESKVILGLPKDIRRNASFVGFVVI
jgi:hypothetical protein